MSRIAVTLLLLLVAAPALADQPKVELAVRGHQFVPAELAIPAGAKVELVVRNDQSTPAEFESTSLHREKVVLPGTATSVYVGPLNAGRYEFFDDFHPATRGFLVVK